MAEQLIRLDSRAKDVTLLFEKNKARMLAQAPKSTGDALRIFQICFNHIAYNGDLLVCTQQSLVGGVFEAMKLGISLGGPMQEGWLIPFKRTATLIVGYQGYRNIIDRAGSVVDMHPRAVHIKDEFDYWFGDAPRIIHRPKVATPKSREELRAVYVVANLRRGGRQLEVLEVPEIDDHRSKSRAGQSGPWVNEYVPMALKTGVRKISKYLPKSNELLSRALDLDDKADRGVDQDFELPKDTDWVDAEDAPGQKPSASPMDRLKNRMGIPPEPPAGAPPDIDVTSEPLKDADIDWGEKE